MTGRELRNLRYRLTDPITGRRPMSQAALAALIGVTVTTISRWERGSPIEELRAEGIRARVRRYAVTRVGGQS